MGELVERLYKVNEEVCCNHCGKDKDKGYWLSAYGSDGHGIAFCSKACYNRYTYLMTR